MSMFAVRVRSSWIRKCLFILLINPFVIYGSEREFDKNVTEKIFTNGYTKKINRANESTYGRSATGSNRGEFTGAEKWQQNDSQRQQNGNFRLKRNAPLADEDLFEFMVRIANTPVEWERIRKVLSRIKQEENENRTFTDFDRTFRLQLKKNESKNKLESSKQQPTQPNRDNYATKSTAVAKISSKTTTTTSRNDNQSWFSPSKYYIKNATEIDTVRNLLGDESWPSSDWIRNLLMNSTSAKTFDYDDDDDDDDDERAEMLADEPNKETDDVEGGDKIELDDIDYVDNNDIETTSTKRTTTTSDNEMKTRTSSSNQQAFQMAEASSKLIIPNSDLPNFTYRRVTPDSHGKENSAYIAVSVISEPNDAKNNRIDDENDRVIYEKVDNYDNLEKLETRRRHSRRKYHKP